MPQLFRIGGYIVYLWTNEGLPPEPVHVHIKKGVPSADGTKVWITKSGHALLAHNKSRIPQKELLELMRIIEANSERIVSKWQEIFEETRYYC